MSRTHYTVDKNLSYTIRGTAKLLNVASAKYGGDWNSVPHTHNHVELFYIIGGKGQFLINDELYPVNTNHLVIINPNVPHTEVSLNAQRQEVAEVFRRMSLIRASEVIHPGAGVGYKFNAEGNQVSYRCDLKKVTTINFDRNKVRAYAASLSKQADTISGELDKRMVNTQVAYEEPFDVNDTLAEVLQWYSEGKG